MSLGQRLTQPPSGELDHGEHGVSGPDEGDISMATLQRASIPDPMPPQPPVPDPMPEPGPAPVPEPVPEKPS